MLDTLLCMQLIQQQGRVKQSRYQHQKETARMVWEKLIQDVALQQQLIKKTMLHAQSEDELFLPINTLYRSSTIPAEYAVCGIDGSQIYPDRHEGFSDYLLNIGSAHFSYAAAGSSASLQNRPYVFSGFHGSVVVTPEYVNGQRTQYELRQALDVARHSSKPLIMFDGALIFWHLHTPTMQERFLNEYRDSLQILYEESRNYLGYISASHSGELVQYIQKAAKIFGLFGPESLFDHLVDTDIAEFFLKPGEFTQIFTPLSDLVDLYPPHLKPCFMYIHVGNEIARVELPVYIAQEKDRLALLVAVVLDQVKKGYGYPIALAEAHEQAVVKAADREFFYTMLQLHHQQKNTVSLKLAKKRSAAV